MKTKFLLFALLVSLKSFSQGEASNWFFGNRAGIRFNTDNTIEVLSTPPNPIRISTSEGCSSYSDKDGNLLLYTDGRTVWDQNHLTMPGGDYDAGTGLFGDPSSTQSGIIIPKPGNPNIFYIFTVDEPHHDNAAVYPNQNTSSGFPQDDDGFNNGLNYSIVDISLNGSNGSVGDIISRNNPLITYDTNPSGEEIKYKCSEKVTAVKSKNSDGYWVITHFTNKFYAFKIDLNGVNTTPVITQINPMVPVSGYRRNSIGYLKVSPNGKKIAVAHNQLGTITGGSENNGVVYLYDFDNETGIVSNGISIMENAIPYGIEFSAETKKLYASAESGLYQFDLLSGDIPNSVVQISRRSYSALQLGPDQKIYKANINSDQNYLDVINNPELDGVACNFQTRAVFLQNGLSTFGLPPFITSVFSSAILADNFCEKTPTTFSLDVNGTVDSVIWNFGDGSTASLANSPTHTYLNPGTYTVKADIIIQGNPVVSRKTIQINPLPQAVSSSLTQCSPDGTQTNILFDLSKANDDLTAGIPNRTIAFFLSKSDAETNNNPQATNYKNISNPQTLHVKITDQTTGCSSFTELEIIVNVATISPYSINHCDDGGSEDGFYNFDLLEAQIASDFLSTATISYYKNTDDALLEQNSIGQRFANTNPYSQTIYARIQDAGLCLGIFPIHLNVFALPKIETEITDYICTNLPNKYITLTAGLLTGNLPNLQYDWSTGEKTATISLNLAGIYTVKVTNSLGCEKVRTITVLPSNNATIENIDIVDNTENNTATIHLTDSSLGNYLYSIDDPNGPFQESNHFENIAPGFHTIYVYDDRGCGTVSKEISILKVPKFFSPNGDGYNETWDIMGISPKFYANSKIYIFDRFGKLLADINPLSNGWNGIYNGQPLPSNDYWYVVKLDNGRIIKGHFSLVR
ncbi:T9SS type B sorting domain-containing protein [uncultured Flavobacterium sp.]|uniref:T9SS type B sorting domain-containing protein n=1 Tax=uncultured Flavobacterium sp. TaxID=165435 RepID=UPI0025FA96C7|nr:T9SS type B sorting domain-containing protein [uncultured Flavobacterium sp.]